MNEEDERADWLWALPCLVGVLYLAVGLLPWTWLVSAK